MKRRILSIFMCLCMTLCLLPTVALADSVTEYDIWVGGIRVTSENASSVTGPGITGTVSYDVASNTLTLDGASVTGAYTDGNSNSAAIYASTSTALTIVLSGVNTAVGPNTASRFSYGVYCASALIIEGSGSLNTVGGTETGANGNSFGMCGDSSVTISGSANVTATGGNALICSFGMVGKHGISISDAAVTAAGGEGGAFSFGICGSNANVGVSISGSAKVTATGGKASTGSYGVTGGGNTVVDISVSGTAMVTATGGEVTSASGMSIGIYGNNGTVSFSGGSMVATGGKATSNSYGVYSDCSKIIVNSESEGALNDGLLIAKGETAAANTAPTCGTDSAALTGVTKESIGKFAAWGVSNTYTVLDSTLDLSNNTTTSAWSDPANSRGWRWEYNAESASTLTIKNVIINAPDAASDSAYGIKLSQSEAVNIVLEGVNVVSAGAASSGHSYGVHSGSDFGGSFGSVTVSSTNGGTLSTMAGTASGVSCGICSNSLSISGTVTAIGGTADSVSCGACSSDISLSGTVTAIGGTASGTSIGVFGNSNSGAISLSGTVTAIGGAATTVSSCGVYSDGTISVTDGTVTATGGVASGIMGNSYGVYGNTISVTDGALTATGGTATSADSCGVYGYSDVSVSGGVVTTTGGTAHYNSYGVSGGDGGIILSDTVIATGGTAGHNSYGVYSTNGTITLSGTVTATGGAASTVSCGVYRFSGSVSVTGGTATAFSGTVGSSGSSQAMNLAPDYNSYTVAGVVASTSADGSSPSNYDAGNITTYKYLKIGTLYALTVNLNGGSGATTNSNYMAGDVVSIDAGTKSGYAFSGWTATGGGTFTSTSSAATTYTMPAGAATITANWAANSTGGRDGDTDTTTVPASSGSGAVNLSASVSGGTATVSATSAQLQKIASGTKTDTVKIDASGLKVNTVVVPSKLVMALDDASGSAGLDVTLSTGTVTLDKAALAAVGGKGDVKLSIETVSNSALTDVQRGVLGAQAETAFVVDVNVYVNGSKASTFGDGKISVSVPYTPKSGESADSITVWFVCDDGTIEPKNGVYSAAAGCVEFTTEHLSQYLIVSFPFTDVAEDAWYYGSVAYAYNNGLFAGTSATTFNPDTAVTRQMIWTVLARLDGKTPTDMDAARTWAMEKGISDGTNPTRTITREQMATILYRYAQYKGCDVSIGEETNILSYEDALTISEYAIPAIQWACGAGLMQGSNNSIMPTGSTTRAQVATILQRFCQNVVK